MSTRVTQLAEEIRSLEASEKAELVHAMLLDLDGPADAEAESAWTSEISRRYAAFQEGTVEPVQGEDAMQRIRDKVR